MDREYGLRSFKIPTLSGISLSIAVRLLEGVFHRPLAAKFLRDIGIDSFYSCRARESPTFYPELPFQGEAASSDAPLPDLGRLLAKEPPLPEGFHFPSIRDYANGYRNGTLLPFEVAENVIESIAEMDRHTPPLRAFIASDAADIRKQAEASTLRYRKGKPLSLLDGVPLAVKDEIDQTPYPTTFGTKFLKERTAIEDAAAVERVRAAGALLIGKANMSEIGSDTTGANIHYGFPRNPYNLSHFTGGSSSGSAAAVASGVCPVALSADGGGSIRIPSSLCGLIGIKGTFGRISTRGSYTYGWSVGHIGPIAGSTEDALLAYAAIAGADSKSANGAQQPPLDL